MAIRQDLIKKTDTMGLVESLGIYGKYSESENKELTFIWSAFHVEVDRSGKMRNAKTKYALFRNNWMLTHGTAIRIEAGKVANNGVFVFNDFLNKSGTGAFVCMDQTGQILIKHKFNSNLDSNAISEDGKYAVCVLSVDQLRTPGLVFLFDVENHTLIQSITPSSGRPDSVHINSVDKRLRLIYKNSRESLYDFDGNPIK